MAGVSGGLTGARLSEESGIEKSPKAYSSVDDLGRSGERQRSSERTTEGGEKDDVIWVDFEGPGDAMNPKSPSPPILSDFEI